MENTTNTEARIHFCSVEHAPLFYKWCKERGGVLNWVSASLSENGRSVSTPALGQDGEPYGRPGWQFTKPSGDPFNMDEIQVETTEDIGRLKIRLKISDGQIVLTVPSAKQHLHAIDDHERTYGKPIIWSYASTGTVVGAPVHALCAGEDEIIYSRVTGTQTLREWASHNINA